MTRELGHNDTVCTRNGKRGGGRGREMGSWGNRLWPTAIRKVFSTYDSESSHIVSKEYYQKTMKFIRICNYFAMAFINESAYYFKILNLLSVFSAPMYHDSCHSKKVKNLIKRYFPSIEYWHWARYREKVASEAILGARAHQRPHPCQPLVSPSFVRSGRS